MYFGVIPSQLFVFCSGDHCPFSVVAAFAPLPDRSFLPRFGFSTGKARRYAEQ
jgi:hypothetical protein